MKRWIDKLISWFALPVAVALIVFIVLSMVAGCATVPTSDGSDGQVVTVKNDTGRVASESGGVWRIKEPPKLEFTGRTVTGQKIRKWAAQHGIRAVAVDTDASYAQVTAESAVECVLWLKRFQWDIGYAYIGDSRDCDNFARLARTFPDLFADAAPDQSQAAVFGIYAHMVRSFAGVTDGYHALNVVWTDAGVYVFEPQGVHLTYQLLSDWPNRTGITHGIFD